jgi:hypothetical protein
VLGALGRTFVAVGAAVLVGCAAVEGPRGPAPGRVPESAADARAEAEERAAARPPRTAKRAPIPTRALNLATECSFKDVTGYRGNLRLTVTEAQVRSFNARVDVPEQGTCSFDLADFRQTATLPNVRLNALRSRCVVHMWEQGPRVTVAFNDCESMCTGGAYPYLWPILANSRTGGCG